VYRLLVLSVRGGLIDALAAVLFARAGQVETARRVRVVILATNLIQLYDDFLILDTINL